MFLINMTGNGKSCDYDTLAILEIIGVGAAGQVYSVDDGIVLKACIIFQPPTSNCTGRDVWYHASGTIQLWAIKRLEIRVSLADAAPSSKNHGSHWHNPSWRHLSSQIPHQNQPGLSDLLQLWQAHIIVFIGEVINILGTRHIHSTTNSMWLPMNYILKNERERWSSHHPYTTCHIYFAFLQAAPGTTQAFKIKWSVILGPTLMRKASCFVTLIYYASTIRSSAKLLAGVVHKDGTW